MYSPTPSTPARFSMVTRSLLIKEFLLEEVAKMRVVFGRGDGVQVEERLVYFQLECESRGHGVAPLVSGGSLHILQEDFASTFVQVVHEQLGMLTLLFGLVLEESRDSSQRDVTTVKEEAYRLVDVTCSELHVDLVADRLLAVGATILAYFA